jgi:hypothetical protein
VIGPDSTRVAEVVRVLRKLAIDKTDAQIGRAA